MKDCCGNCLWNMIENEDGEYVNAGYSDGFCIMKDLFTVTKKDDEACGMYDSKKDKEPKVG